MKLGQTSAVTFVSQLVASAVGFVATIYITRALGPDIWGTYRLIWAVVVWVEIVAIMGLGAAVTKRLSEAGDTTAYLSAGALLQGGIFVVVTLLLLAFRGPINRYVGVPATGAIVLLIFAGLAFMFVTSALKGQHLVHVASVLRPVDQTLRSGLQIGATLAGLGLFGLIYGHVLAALIASVIGLFFVSYRLTRPRREHFSGLLSYARYSWLGDLEARAFMSMDTIVLGFFVSNALIGIYEIAWNLAAFLGLFGTAISQALFPELSKLSSGGELERVEGLLEDALAFTGLFLLPGFVGSLVLGGSILRIYGPAFPRGYEVLVIHVLAYLGYTYAGQFTNTLNGLDRPDLTFRVNAAFIAVNAVLNVALVYLYSWIGAAVATATASAVRLLLGRYYLGDLLTVRVPAGEIARQVVGAVAMGLVVLAGRVVLGGGVPAAVVLVAVGAGVYFLVLLAISERLRVTIQRNLI